MAFVFGAAVTNNRKKRRSNNSSILSNNSTTSIPSDSSVVQNLHDEEAKLLAQLAATRNKLKAASKPTSLSNHNNSRTSPGRTQQQQQQQQQQQHLQQQYQQPPERLSLPNVSTRVIPILSSTGEPVFEVGLNGSSTNEHVLPVFRLPQVDDSAEFVNRIPTELTQMEAEREEENRADDEALAASLGLSMSELAEFQMEAAERTGNKQQLRRAWESQRSLSRDGGSRLLDGPESTLRPAGLPALQLGGDDDDNHSQLNASQSLGHMKRPRPTDVSDAYGTRKTPRCLQHGCNPTREQLRGELKKSIK